MSREQQQMTDALFSATEINGVSVIMTNVKFEQQEAPNGLPGMIEGRFEGVVSGPLAQRFGEDSPIMSAREAMQRAIASVLDSDDGGARLWLDIARELREGEWLSASVKGIPLRTGGIVHSKPGPETVRFFLDGTKTGTDFGDYVGATMRKARERAQQRGAEWPPKEVRPERAETEVLQRAQDESTPAYEAAGQTLGDTQSLPRRVATPPPVPLMKHGEFQSCVNCGAELRWSEQWGWRHAAGQALTCPEQG